MVDQLKVFAKGFTVGPAFLLKQLAFELGKEVSVQFRVERFGDVPSASQQAKDIRASDERIIGEIAKGLQKVFSKKNIMRVVLDPFTSRLDVPTLEGTVLSLSPETLTGQTLQNILDAATEFGSRFRRFR